MQVSTSNAIIQVLRLYCSYAGNTFCYSCIVCLSVAIMHVTVSVAIMQLEVSAALMQVTVTVLNMWVTMFIVFMQVVHSAVHNCFCYKMQVTVSVIAMAPTFHKIDRKIFKGILSGLHFTTFEIIIQL